MEDKYYWINADYDGCFILTNFLFKPEESRMKYFIFPKLPRCHQDKLNFLSTCFGWSFGRHWEASEIKRKEHFGRLLRSKWVDNVVKIQMEIGLALKIRKEIKTIELMWDLWCSFKLLCEALHQTLVTGKASSFLFSTSSICTFWTIHLMIIKGWEELPILKCLFYLKLGKTFFSWNLPNVLTKEDGSDWWLSWNTVAININ